ncbi:hypothetical protein Tco_0189266 [Tanacetum coccineum]
MLHSDSEINQTKFTATTYKRGLATLEEQFISYRNNEVLFSEEVAVLKREVACKDYEINVLKSEFEKVKKEKEGIEFKIEKFDKASKDLDQLLGSQITDKKSLKSNVVCDKKSDDSKENSNNSLVKEQVSKDTSSFVESSLNVNKETVFLIDKKAQCKYHQKERMVYGNNYNRVNYNYTIKRTHPNAQRNMVPRAVLMKTGLKPFNIAHPKSIVFSAKPLSCFPKIAQSTVKRPFQSKTTLSIKRFIHKVNTAKAQAVNTARPQAVNTARPKTVKTARPNSAVVNVVRVNQKITTAKQKHVKRARDTKIPQSSGPLVKVSDEAVHKELDDRMERAATIASSLEAEHDSGSGPRCQDTILGDVDAQTRFETTSK